MVKYCALGGKSTKFGKVMLLNNISYGPQSEEEFVLRGWGGFSFQINCFY